MINATFFSLSLSSISNSPLIAKNPSYLNQKSTFLNTNLYKFFNSFYYSKAAHDTSFLSCNFDSFLHSPIRMMKDDNDPIPLTYNLKFYNSTLDFRFLNFKNVTITDCYFRKCFSPEDGGAIAAQIDNSLFFIKSTGFYKCTCKTRGGAINYMGNNLSISTSCFTKCFTADTSMTLFLSGNIDYADITMEFSSISKCSPIEEFSPISRESMTFNSAVYKINHINCSENYIGDAGACFSQYERADIYFNYNTICNNTGKSLFTFESFFNLSFSLNNIYYNGNPVYMNLFEFLNGGDSIVISGCRFILNSFTEFVSSSALTTVMLKDSKFDFPQTSLPQKDTYKFEISNSEFDVIKMVMNDLEPIRTWNCWHKFKTTTFPKHKQLVLSKYPLREFDAIYIILASVSFVVLVIIHRVRNNNKKNL